MISFSINGNLYSPLQLAAGWLGYKQTPILNVMMKWPRQRMTSSVKSAYFLLSIYLQSIN